MSVGTSSLRSQKNDVSDDSSSDSSDDDDDEEDSKDKQSTAVDDEEEPANKTWIPRTQHEVAVRILRLYWRSMFLL